jgi:hypothetical protein
LCGANGSCLRRTDAGRSAAAVDHWVSGAGRVEVVPGAVDPEGAAPEDVDPEADPGGMELEPFVRPEAPAEPEPDAPDAELPYPDDEPVP